MIYKHTLRQQILTNIGPKPLEKSEYKIQTKFNLGKNLKIVSFGKHNKDKIFYIIKRTPGSGLFSNLTFVLNHISICNSFNLIPIIDMKNFTTIYNEQNKINGHYNVWEYYFEKLNKYSLKEVYQSQNVIFCNSIFGPNMTLDMKKEKTKKIFNKIKIKKNITNKFDLYIKKNFTKSEKILGVHFRGSTYKVAKTHPFPPTINLILEEVDLLLLKNNYKKIFLVTEEKKYLDAFKKKYGDLCITYDTFRMNKKDLFKIYPRKNHRYKMGEETIIDTLILSKCNGLLFTRSNLISAAMLFSKKKQKYHEIFLGYNSRNKFVARWLWYIKCLLPKYLGGLRILR